MNAHQSAGEKLIRISPEHWIKYVFPAFVYLVLMVACISIFLFAGWVTYHQPQLSYVIYLGAFLLFFVVHHWFFIWLLGETMTHIVVTNQRVVHMHESLFTSEKMSEYAFEKMKTVGSYKKGFLQTLFRYGSIRFESGNDIKLVPHPGSIVKEIEQAMGAQ
jgi:hypothetical protein